METHFAQAIRDRFAVRSDERVYYFEPLMRDVELENRKGIIKFAYYLTNRPDGTSERHYVAIKIYKRRFFLQNPALFNEFNTNLHFLQTLGDNIHVLGCIEALQDQNHYFVIQPFCDGGDLLQDIPHTPPQHVTEEMEARTRATFKKMLECIDYINSNGIYHGKIKPEHFVKSGDKVLLTNFGKARPSGQTEHHVENPLELDYQVSYDADLWACKKIFFLILTGEPLYHQALIDFRYEYFIQCEGLSENPATQPLRDAFFLACTYEQQVVIYKCLRVIRTFTPSLRALVAKAFDSTQTWTVREILNSGWMRGIAGPAQDFDPSPQELNPPQELNELDAFDIDVDWILAAERNEMDEILGEQHSEATQALQNIGE